MFQKGTVRRFNKGGGIGGGSEYLYKVFAQPPSSDKGEDVSMMNEEHRTPLEHSAFDSLHAQSGNPLYDQALERADRSQKIALVEHTRVLSKEAAARLKLEQEAKRKQEEEEKTKPKLMTFDTVPGTHILSRPKPSQAQVPKQQIQIQKIEGEGEGENNSMRDDDHDRTQVPAPEPQHKMADIQTENALLCNQTKLYYSEYAK